MSSDPSVRALDLQRSVPLVLAFSLYLGLADMACGQTLAEVQATLDALDARRQAPAAQATFQVGPVLPAAPATAVSATTTTAASPSTLSNDIPALRFAVTSINESRNTQGRGIINLTFAIMGEGLPPTAALRQITVTKAVDNLGHVLGSSTSGGATAALMQSRLMMNFAGGRGTGPLTGQVSLDASVRKAESLQYVEGTIEMFLPSEANGSIIRIPNILSHTGRIEHPSLAKEGIEFNFGLPDQATYDEAKIQVGTFFQLGAQSPENRVAGVVYATANAVSFSLRDPSGRLASHQLQDAKGTPLRTIGTSTRGGSNSHTGTIRLLAPLPADAQLVLFLATPDTLTTVPFRVEDIALP